MKYRDHRGRYDDSMAAAIELADFAALYAHCSKVLEPFGFFFEQSSLHVEPYSGVDSRNGWDTHIVTIDGYGVMGFTDGPALDQHRRRSMSVLFDQLLWLILPEGAFRKLRDRCETCGGSRGGVRGNENIVESYGKRVIMCDYCSADELIRNVIPTPGNPARSQGNDDAKISNGPPHHGEAVETGMGEPRA